MDSELDLTDLKDRMLARRNELEELKASHAGDGAPVELDQTRVGRLSRMDALQSQAMAQETERRRAIELTKIEAALSRITEGEFGYCVACGEEIGLKRLELDPTVPLCIDCARSSGRKS